LDKEIMEKEQDTEAAGVTSAAAAGAEQVVLLPTKMAAVD
jgi:hypothetical protein